MRVLLCGASGFIGQHLKRGLIESGHSVISALRQPRNAEEIGVDYCTDTQPETWQIPLFNHIRPVPQAVQTLPEGDVAAASDVIRAVMAGAAEPSVRLSVPLGVEIGTGPSWGAAH